MSGSSAIPASAAVPLMVDSALSSAFPASVAFKPTCDRAKAWSMKDFDVDKKMLGEGRFGRVFRVRHRGSRKICVLKAMEKSAILAEDVLSQLKREVEVHTRLKHPHIIECYGHFQDNDRLYLVLEHADGGMLYQHLMSLKDRKMTERDAARVCQQVASALDYLHSINVMHRDLKPENILLAAIPGAGGASSSSSGELMDRYTVKVCDFGWSVPMKVDSRRVTLCGTVEYLPPEVASGDQYDFGFDMWTLGILVFEMLAGFSPFSLTQEEVALYGHDPEAANAMIVKKISELTFNVPAHFSRAAADLVKRLLKGNGETRLSPQQVLTHPWITRHCGPYTAATGSAADTALVLATGGTIAPWDNSSIPVPPANQAAVLLASSVPAFARDPLHLQAAAVAFEAQQAMLASSKGVQAPSVKAFIQRKLEASEELAEGFKKGVDAAIAEEAGKGNDENAAQAASAFDDASAAVLPDFVAALMTAHADGVLPSSMLQEMKALRLFDHAGAGDGSTHAAAAMLSPVRPAKPSSSSASFTPSAHRGTASKAARGILATPRGAGVASFAAAAASVSAAAPAAATAATPKSGRKGKKGGNSNNNKGAPGSAAKRVIAGPTVPIPAELLAALE